jgi:hypothetical protein
MVWRLPEGVREAVRERLVAELESMRVSAAPEGDEGGTLEPGEAEAEAEVAVEILSQDPRVRRQTSGWTDERLRALYRCFHRVVLERLVALEGRDFGSDAAKRRAVAAVVKQAIAEVAHDPVAWTRQHCERA